MTVIVTELVKFVFIFYKKKKKKDMSKYFQKIVN